MYTILHLCKMHEPCPAQTGDEGMETSLFSHAGTIANVRIQRQRQ